jgi:Ca2+-binding RTX toxin-like protein
LQQDAFSYFKGRYFKMPINEIGIISNGLLTALQASIAKRKPGKPLSLSPLFFSTSKIEKTEKENEVSGTFVFKKLNSVIPLGTSEVTVEVSDLILDSAERNVVVDKKTYKLPAYSKGAKADITGTDQKDVIKIFQDSDGNTKIEARKNGMTSDINLGKIAALNVYGLGGDDEIEVKVDNLFGGIVIEGGAGKDKLNIKANKSFSKGISLNGGAGDDIITISGSAFALLAEGGAGNDQIIANKLNPSAEFARLFFGNDGSDLISATEGDDCIYGGDGGDALYGKNGNDKIYGEAGNDLLSGGKGSDFLWGGAGNDFLSDTSPYSYNHNFLSGGAGNDLLEAGSGADRLLGGGGNDALYAGAGRDVLIDTVGIDTFAPGEFYWKTVHPAKKYNSYISLNLQGVTRRQTLLSAYNGANKVINGYDSSEDYLVDRDFLS